MEDSIKTIFKTLIKVPVIIMVSYLIFNIFAFGISYLKILGLSYVVMQTAIENNYIPQEEKNSLELYMTNSIQTPMLQNVSFTPNTTYTRRQYGNMVTAGVQATYKFIWPLSPPEINAGVSGQPNEQNANIVIEYQVPGLTYYPDLNN